MDWLSQFEGTWRLYRVIEDRLAKRRLVFEGEADLYRDGEGLTYFEHGRWTRSEWGGMAATRKLLWRDAGGRVAVFYDDGRSFHAFEPSEDGRSEGGHDCAPDRYDVTYRFGLPDRWEADWRAIGPAKDYLSRTRYDRSLPET